MRDKVIAISTVAIAGVAVVAGLTIGALGGAFDDGGDKVQPPALRSDLSVAVTATSSSVITVPPSPTWRVATPTTPKPTTSAVTTTPSESNESTTRPPRGRTTTEESTASDEPAESDEQGAGDDSSETPTSTTR